MTGSNVNEEKVQKDEEKHENTEKEKKNREREFIECEWMIRPCDLYKEEYDDCTSMKGRFHQYFIYGENIDCSQWKKDHDNCVQWKKHQSQNAFNDLIASEKSRRMARLRAHYENDVWQKRNKPPERWNEPLPEWMQKQFKGTYLDLRSEEYKKDKSPVAESSCTIS